MTFVERKSRFYVALSMPNRSKDAMAVAINRICDCLPLEALKTFTSDRGKEFACSPEVEAKSIEFYFADAYNAWQRRSNENANGLLREFFPKKTDLVTITLRALYEALCSSTIVPENVWDLRRPLKYLCTS